MQAATTNANDPRRPNKVVRYKAPVSNGPAEDPTPDYMNLLGMIFSMCGLMMKLKWCAWCAVYCSFISFANSRASEDTKQTLSSFIYRWVAITTGKIVPYLRFADVYGLSISAVVMSYLQNPQPMTPPWQ